MSFNKNFFSKSPFSQKIEPSTPTEKSQTSKHPIGSAGWMLEQSVKTHQQQLHQQKQTHLNIQNMMDQGLTTREMQGTPEPVVIQSDETLIKNAEKDIAAEKKSQDHENIIPSTFKKQSILQKGHNVLEAAGMIPALGIVPDLMNAAWYKGEEIANVFSRGSFPDAATNKNWALSAAMPGLGLGATSAKWASKTKNFFTGGSKLSKANRGFQSTDYLSSSGHLIQKGSAENISKIKDINRQLADKGVIKSSHPIVYTHGTGSGAFPNIIKEGGIQPRGSLIGKGKVPQTGELSGLGMGGGHVNKSFVSASGVSGATTAENLSYSLSSKPTNVLSDYNKLIDDIADKKYTDWDPKTLETLKTIKEKRVYDFYKSSKKDKKLISENYPVMFGINPKSTKLGKERYITPTMSSPSREVGIKGNIGLDEISNVFVPKSKVKFTQKYLKNSGIKNINVGSMENLLSKSSGPKFYTNEYLNTLSKIK